MEPSATTFTLCVTGSLRAAVDRLEGEEFDVILADLSLPDSHGIDTVKGLLSCVAEVPIVVMTGVSDEILAMRALQAGAEDYLVKGDGDALVLKRAIRYAIERKAANNRLRDSEEKLSSILASIDNVIWSFSDQRILYLSPVAQVVYGRSVEEFYENPNLWFDIVHPEDVAGVHTLMARLPEAGTIRHEYRILWPTGEVRWIEDRATAVFNAHGKLLRLDGVASDITERKRYELHVEHLAHHDALTGLANRALLADRLPQAMIHARRKKRQFALLFLDVDRFKDVNDTFGHAYGDEVIKAVATRLLEVVREGDTVARQGGDEFIILLTDIESAEDVTIVANKLLHAFSMPFSIKGHLLYLTPSIGATVYPTDSEDASTLMSNADMAMYRAKYDGGNTFHFYSLEMTRRATERIEISNALSGALERCEFELYYQPKVDIKSGQMIGMEALIRWNHPEMGVISPALFIPVAEETGMILAIGEWVLATACAQNQAWQKAGLPPLRVAVNLSPRQFSQEGLLQLVRHHLEISGLDAKFLELEITEGVMISNPAQALDILQGFREMGISLSLDDFGTGYASLAYLQRFQFDSLKIDRAFINDITVNPSHAAIALAMIDIAHRLNLSVIAEGVQTQDQVSFLQDHDCDEIQGYFYSDPIPAYAFETLMRESKIH